MMVVRPVRPADLPALERLAGCATPRLTNLPAHRDRLEERIARSRQAFAREVDFPGDEHYTFVLEDLERGEVAGTATIRAEAGASEAYYTYRQETLIHASQQLNVRREVQTLALSTRSPRRPCCAPCPWTRATAAPAPRACCAGPG